jgi:hypothetical protein
MVEVADNLKNGSCDPHFDEYLKSEKDHLISLIKGNEENLKNNLEFNRSLESKINYYSQI